MTKKKYIGLIFVFSFLLMNAFAVRFERVSILDGLSNGLVNSIIQDKKGFIWIATEDGLNRYDGYQFTVFRPQKSNQSSISSNICKVVYEDSEGYLWIGTVGGGLNRFDPRTEQFVCYKNISKQKSSLSDNNVYSIFEDHNKTLWVGTFGGGLNKFDKKTGQFKRYDYHASNLRGISGNAVRAITEDRQGLLWLAVDEGGLDCFNPKTEVFTHYNTKNSSISTNVLLSVYIDKQDNIWCGTWGGGVNELNPVNQKIESYTHHSNNTNSLASNENFAMVQDANSNLWITTRNGLDCFNLRNRTFSHYRNDVTDETSLSDNLTTSLCIDRSGVLWIGTWGSGLCKLNLLAKPFYHIKNRLNNSNSLSSNNVFSLFEDSEGIIWIGTKNTGVDSYNPRTNQFKNFHNNSKDKTSLSSNVVRAICDAEPGYLWVGTDGGGLNRMNKRSGQCEVFIASGKSNALSNNAIYCLRYEKESKKLWIGTYGGGLNCLDVVKRQFQHFSVNHFNQMKDVVLSVARDGDGRLWVATGGMGLLYFDENKQSFFSYRNIAQKGHTLSSDVINTIASNGADQLWVGTAGAGLDLLNVKTGVIKHFDMSKGLPNEMIASLAFDLKQNLWIGTNNGLSMYDPFSDLFRNFSLSDGLQDVVFNANASIFSSGKQLYFGGINGINYWNPDSIASNPTPPGVVLTDFKIFNKSVYPYQNQALKQSITYSNSLVLSYKLNVVTFEFAALHYAASKQNKYAYMLEGFDSRWNYTTADRRFATYTNLPGGSYTFRVKASNSDGVWNRVPTSVVVRIIPPFWKTVYFYILVGLFCVALVYLAYRYRIRSFERKRKDLENSVRIRTEELSLQKQELIQINEQLNQQTEELKVQGDSLREINSVLNDQAKQLRFKSEMLLATNEEIKSKNKLVTESIRYAKRIQDSILPSAQHLDGLFMEYFILYKPRDIVSGDFYWFAQPTEDEWGRPVEDIIIAAVDCTGHGVPGAFMSIIGNTQLNQIVHSKGILKPGDILTELNNGIINALSAQESSSDFSDDGMDISICTINPSTGIVHFGSAMQKIYFVSAKKGLTVIEGDIFSIGELFSIIKRPTFATATMEYEAGDMIYLFSDGITDQFGGKKREKFQESRFRELIESIHTLPAQRQKDIIYQTFEDWKSNESQLDDVMVLGFRLK